MRRADLALHAIVSITLLTACGADSPTGPQTGMLTAGVMPAAVHWRGATISGMQAGDAVPWVEAGWQAAQRTFGPTGEPQGWTIELQGPLISCPFYGGQCGGLFIGREKRILASWSVPAAQRDGLMAHEFCRFVFFQRTGNAQAPACAGYYGDDAF